MRDGPRVAELRGEGVRARQASTGVVAGAGAAAGAITSSRGRSGPQAWARAVSEVTSTSSRSRRGQPDGLEGHAGPLEG